MTYTQTAFTGRTGARPITALTRELTRRMKVVDATGIQVSKQDARRAVKALKGAIGVSNGAIETLMDLVQLTWEADWTDDRPLVVWPSNQHLADEVRKTVACIKARLRELRAAGLILGHDSASGRRSGFRNRDGVIVEAYGLDLSPIRLRYAELKDAGDRLSALYALFKSGKKEIARVRRIVGQA
ncbi:helix-turn-helix domain-containing protein, partial [Pseudomonas sp. EL_65y_Pfl2_R96]|uniref:helix-turn-helix domain-containing protein n=1 Tax=Pseudomonas sp. EL_65y_Pfl2_R96 TaxID=3088699 RepID=UPI0030DC8984